MYLRREWLQSDTAQFSASVRNVGGIGHRSQADKVLPQSLAQDVPRACTSRIPPEEDGDGLGHVTHGGAPLARLNEGLLLEARITYGNSYNVGDSGHFNHGRSICANLT